MNDLPDKSTDNDSDRDRPEIHAVSLAIAPDSAAALKIHLV
jgi:hypothetical protein